MKKILAIVLLGCLLGCVENSVYAQDTTDLASDAVVISTGLIGGGYWRAGSRLQTAASGLGLNVENLDSSGSLTSLERLYSKDSPVSLAFVQADALQYFLSNNPAAGEQFEKLETIGEECVFIISDKGGNIASDTDMQTAERLYLGIRSPQSGIYVTYSYMATLVPELKGISLTYGDTVDMMNDFVHPKTNMDRAVMVVHGTNAHSPEIDMAAASPDKFRFVKITDKRFTQGAAGNNRIYHAKKVKSGVADKTGSVKTICVPGLLMANTAKLSATQHDTVVKVVLNHWAEIHPPE